MNVIFGDEQRKLIGDKHITLELDTVRLVDKDGKQVPGSELVPIYGIIGPGDIPLTSLPAVDRLIELHEALIKNYKAQNWDFCEQALEHLRGEWTTVVDEFYEQLTNRIFLLKENTPEDWTPVLDRVQETIT